MITDRDTNFVYLSDKLQADKYGPFLNELQNTLKRCDISSDFLPGTQDIWAVDFMPIQIRDNKFIQFIYNPDYLQSKVQKRTISDPQEICRKIGIQASQAPLTVDGGNVIRSSDSVIMCDKIFQENPQIEEKKLIKTLQELFEVDKMIFVPWDKSDFIGHADGMVRFVNSQTVFINSCPKQGKHELYHRSLRLALHNAGLDTIEIPCFAYENKSPLSARGVYINFLQVGEHVIIPTFECKEDENAMKVFEQYCKSVSSLQSNLIADQGGVLNCISWNIKLNRTHLTDRKS